MEKQIKRETEKQKNRETEKRRNGETEAQRNRETELFAPQASWLKCCAGGTGSDLAAK